MKERVKLDITIVPDKNGLGGKIEYDESILTAASTADLLHDIVMWIEDDDDLIE